MKMSQPVKLALFVAGLAQSLPSMAGVIAILHPAPNTWQVQESEKVSINGKNRLRAAPPAAGPISPDTYKKLPVVAVGQAPARWHRSGYLLTRSEGAWTPVAPDGLNLKTPATLAASWADARVEFQAHKGPAAQIPASQVVAILPGADPDQAVVSFVKDPANFTGVGEKSPSDVFEERMALLVGLSQTASAGVSTEFKKILLAPMSDAIAKSQHGTVQYQDIVEGLKYAGVSERAFPSDPTQKEARATLKNIKSVIDRHAAILSALYAGEQFDPFILKYASFEPYDNSFDELRHLREQSFSNSAKEHAAEGDRLHSEKQYGAAYRELQIALSRSPEDKSIEAKLEDYRLDEAVDYQRRHPRKPRDPRDPTQRKLTQHLALVEADSKDPKTWPEAETELAAAEAIDKNSAEVLLAKVELYRAERKFADALASLDKYDRLAVEDEVANSTRLRVLLKDGMKKGMKAAEDDLAAAENRGDFKAARAAAAAGMQLTGDNIVFLRKAGFLAAVTRQKTDAEDLLTRYLAASEPYFKEAPERAKARAMLAQLKAQPPAPPTGPVNWFSGFRAAPGVFYCPASLIPNARPIEIHGSRKEVSNFVWAGDQLTSVRTSATDGTEDVTIHFDYFRHGKGVERIGTDPLDDAVNGTTRFTSEGTFGPGKGAYFALFNNPAIDPYLARQHFGQNLGTIVAGNPYLVPFVWQGIFTFSAEYDATGHVIALRQFGKAEKRSFQLKWDGDFLKSIAETGGGYLREMSYSGGRIAMETIHFLDKTYKIQYRYKNDRLQEAEFDADPALDGRSRKVTFE